MHQNFNAGMFAFGMESMFKFFLLQVYLQSGTNPAWGLMKPFKTYHRSKPDSRNTFLTAYAKTDTMNGVASKIGQLHHWWKWPS